MTNELTPRSSDQSPSSALSSDDDSRDLTAIESEISEIVDDPDKKERVLSVIHRYYSGPIPPEVVKAYNELCPGFSRKYLETIPAESVHQRRIEACEVRANFLEILAPLTAGLIYAAMAFGCGIYFLTQGQPGLGSVIIGGVVVYGIFAFVGKKPPSDNA